MAREGTPPGHLYTAIRPQIGVAVSGARFFRIRGEAGIGESARAVEAEPAGDVEGQHHAVAPLDGTYGFADLFDDAHIFMPENDAGLGRTSFFVHVKIASADNRGCDTDDRVAAILEFRVGNLLHRDFVLSFVNDSFMTV